MAGEPPAGGDEGLQRLHELLLARGGLVATLLEAPSPGAAAVGAAPESEAPEAAVGAAPESEAPAGAATELGAPGSDGSRPAVLAAAGPRAAGRREEYELLLEAIYEGYLLHYGVPRLVRAPEADVGLLAGDQLYAVGLARLVELGDTDAVAELADTITLSALAQAHGDPELAEAVWQAGARAVGWGPSAEHDRAKELLREGAPEALAAMRTSAQAPAPAS